MPPRSRRTTHQPEQTPAATPALDENATTDQPQTPAARDAEPTGQDDLIPQDGLPAERADDLLSAMADAAEQQPRIACPECTPPGGLPPTATAFACIHGSWDLT